MKNVLLAVHGSAGNVGLSFAKSLAATIKPALDANITLYVDYVDSYSGNVSTSLQKNILANRVLQSKEPELDGVLFTYPNMSWDTEEFIKLVSYSGTGILSGAFPDSFAGAEVYPITLKENFSPEVEVLPALFVTTGFVYVPKSVLVEISKIAEKASSNGSNSAPDFYLFFQEKLESDGLLYSEDHTFCKLIIDSGLDISVDPTINIVNTFLMPARTNYQEYLKKQHLDTLGEHADDGSELPMGMPEKVSFEMPEGMPEDPFGNLPEDITQI
jgi:hypothetical protein